MKVLLEKTKVKRRAQITIQITEEILKKVDKIAQDASVARQRVIEVILKEALAMPSFSIKLP